MMMRMVAVGGRIADEQVGCRWCRRRKEIWGRMIEEGRRVMFGLLAGGKIAGVWSPLRPRTSISTVRAAFMVDTYLPV